MAEKTHRKKFFVVHSMQLRFACVVLVFMLACCAVTGAVVFYSMFSVLQERLAGIYPEARLGEIAQSVYFSLFSGFFILTPVIFCGAIIFSHRVAGPLPKIHKALKDIGEGHFDVRLTLRKNDELKELAQEINAMAANLTAREVKR